MLKLMLKLSKPPYLKTKLLPKLMRKELLNQLHKKLQVKHLLLKSLLKPLKLVHKPMLLQLQLNNN